MELFAVKSSSDRLWDINSGPLSWDPSVGLVVNHARSGLSIADTELLAYQFAAAPMMVEALKAVLDGMDNQDYQIAGSTLALIRAALAKAQPPLPDGSEFPKADAEVAL